DRVIRSPLLVRGIVATRSVRARHLEAKLLLVKIRTLELQSCDTHEHDASAFAAHSCRLSDRFVAVGRCCYEHPVDTPAAGETLGSKIPILSPVGFDRLGPESPRQAPPR